MASSKASRGKLVSQIELAELFGKDRSTIQAWTRKGMPCFEESFKPGQPKLYDFAAVLDWRDSQLEGAPSSDAELRRRKLEAETTVAEIEAAKAKGLVAPVADMERAMELAFGMVRTNMRQIPGRAVAELIGETDEVRFKEVLHRHIDGALEPLAGTDLDAAEQEVEFLNDELDDGVQEPGGDPTGDHPGDGVSATT